MTGYTPENGLGLKECKCLSATAIYHGDPAQLRPGNRLKNHYLGRKPGQHVRNILDIHFQCKIIWTIRSASSATAAQSCQSTQPSLDIPQNTCSNPCLPPPLGIANQRTNPETASTRLARNINTARINRYWYFFISRHLVKAFAPIRRVDRLYHAVQV
jgi:hypothetical protein